MHLFFPLFIRLLFLYFSCSMLITKAYVRWFSYTVVFKLFLYYTACIILNTCRLFPLYCFLFIVLYEKCNKNDLINDTSTLRRGVWTGHQGLVLSGKYVSPLFGLRSLEGDSVNTSVSLAVSPKADRSAKPKRWIDILVVSHYVFLNIPGLWNVFF